MKRLFVQYSCFYPAYKAGGPIQSLMYLLERLNNTFEIFLLTTCYDLDGTKLDVIADRWIKTKFGNVFYSSKITYKQIKLLIAKVNPDLFYLNSFFSFFTIRTLLILRKDKRKVVIAPRGEFSSNALSLKSGKKKGYIFLFNSILFNNKICWHFTNTQELQDCKNRLPIQDTQCRIVPNLHIVEFEKNYFQCSNKKQGGIKIVSVGRISPMKNIDFLVEILSKVMGDVICDIYGTIEDRKYYFLCEKKLKLLPKNITLNFRGEIKSSDVIKTISKYDLFFSPSMGENFGHAIFESLIAGLPILISDKVPFFNEVEFYEAGFVISLEDRDSFIRKIDELILCTSNQFLLLKQNVYNYLKYLDKKINDINVYIKLFE